MSGTITGTPVTIASTMYDVDVLNLALGKIGAKSVTALDNIKSSLIDGEKLVVQKRNEVFDKPIDWHFATTRAELTEHTSEPVCGSYEHYFVLPANCRRIITTLDEGGDIYKYDYRRELVIDDTVLTPVIACNEEEVFVKYIYLIEDPDKWPSWFVNLVACEIAVELVESYKQDGGGLYQKIYSMYEKALNDAKAANQRENITVNHQGEDSDQGNTDILNAAYEGIQ